MRTDKCHTPRCRGIVVVTILGVELCAKCYRRYCDMGDERGRKWLRLPPPGPGIVIEGEPCPHVEPEAPGRRSPGPKSIVICADCGESVALSDGWSFRGNRPICPSCRAEGERDAAEEA